MFTGLIETTGTVLCVTPEAGVTRITIGAPASLVSRLSTGDSVAVSGVCLTALDIEPNAFPPRFSADLAAETIARTTLSRLKSDTVVNLELPTPAGSPLGGHVVQGHVDGTATLVALEAITPGTETTDYRLRLTVPDALMRYIVEKGSITVEGISLTVASVQGDQVEIAIIPHTYAATSLRTLSPGEEVNIEVDVLGKYAERKLEAPKAFDLTEEYLIANGY
ncbi:riboflavin synthase [Edaphobacter sp. 12200R-103]|uniref:riboflavin synthase n=1 Tax=Edaphobacter sp. 12200R-103 TaxID=2703788 RepID=UPI00138B542D|nr:riboflavin synthase [Edaphobacter sp. 12200R-103]QHS51887.1 riboflavin synthase [Edaphobacter sp. 12200R-103]